VFLIAELCGGLLPVGGEIELCRSFELKREGDDVLHAGDSVGAHACGGLGDEVPDGLFADDAQGVDGSAGGVAVGSCVAEGELAVLGEGALHDGQRGDIVREWSPAGGVDVEARADRVCVGAHGDGEGGHQLVVGALGSGGEFAVSESAGLDHEQALKLGVIEAGDLGAPALLQLPSALCAAMRDERNACDAESFHVAMRGALGDFEAFGYLSGGEASVGLEQHECGEEAVGFHLVVRFIPFPPVSEARFFFANYDRGCHICLLSVDV
jgi:hypothetical protein